MQPIRNCILNTPTTPISFQKPQRQVAPVTFKGGLAKDVVQISSKTSKSLLENLGNTISAVLGLKEVATPEKLKGFQKEFQNLFLREDISLEETKNIIKNYQKIAKIKDDRDFVQAIYNELKSNYGFGHVDLPLEFRTLQKSDKGTTIASTNVVMNRVFIHPDIRREKAPQVLFHELRHVKQNFFAACYDIMAYVDGIIKRIRPNLKNENIPEGAVIEAKTKLAAGMMNRWGMLVRPRVPKSNLEYAKTCLDAHINYVSPHKDLDIYLKNFLESDAYGADAQFAKVHKKAKKLIVQG